MEINVDNKIIEEFGLADLPDDIKKENLNRLSNALFKNVGLRILDILPENDLDEFNRLVSTDENSALDFLSSKISNLEQIINEEIAVMKQERDELFSGIK